MEKIIQDFTDKCMEEHRRQMAVLVDHLSKTCKIHKSEIVKAMGENITSGELVQNKSLHVPSVSQKSVTKSNAVLLRDIERLTKGGKYYNVETKRAITKNLKNEKKYVFYDKLHIAGYKDSEALKKALKELNSEAVNPSPRSDVILANDYLSDSE